MKSGNNFHSTKNRDRPRRDTSSRGVEARARAGNIVESEPLLGDSHSSGMEICCQCLGDRTPKHLTPVNSRLTAIGDGQIPHARRLYLTVAFPQDTGVRPMHMFFSLANEGTRVLEAACSAAGLKMEKGRLTGSPERLNLFTLEGDNLRLDLDLDAHIPSTLQPDTWVILEKGNRVDSSRLNAIRDAAVAANASPGCLVM
jgi:hypothetical protein